MQRLTVCSAGWLWSWYPPVSASGGGSQVIVLLTRTRERPCGLQKSSWRKGAWWPGPANEVSQSWIQKSSEWGLLKPASHGCCLSSGLAAQRHLCGFRTPADILLNALPAVLWVPTLHTHKKRQARSLLLSEHLFPPSVYVVMLSVD